MSRKGKNKRKHRGELGGSTEAFVLKLEKYSAPLTILVLLLILVFATYLRVLPALRFGINLDASDPWIVYWEARYFKENGLLSLEGLKDVKEFWWPYGRNFLKSEYLGMAWLAAATYPIGQAFGLSLKEWLALFPVFAGIAGTIVVFILVLRVTGSKLAALTAAAFYAFLPGSISRTTVGFVEKIGFALPFIGTYYIFLFEMLKEMLSGGTPNWRRVYINAVLAGIFGGLVAFFWGGFIFVLLSAALILLFDPIVDKPSMDRFGAYLLKSIIMIAVMGLSPKLSFKYFVAGLGAVVPAALVLYYLEIVFPRTSIGRRLLPDGVNYKLQLWLLAVLIVIGALAIQSGLLGYTNLRYVAALGIRNIDPLVESIQENKPLSARAMIFNYGIALLIGVGGIAVFLARVAAGYRDKFYILSRVFFYTLFIFAVYINKQLAYFTQASSFYVTIGGAIGVADIIMGGVTRTRRERLVADPMKILAGIFIVLLVGISSVYYGVETYKQNSLRAPQILTSGLGALRTGNETIIPFNKAWLNALAWIRNNTREDAIIVSWWDYGYWITVNTGRRTLADGVTFNETQIRWLAEILTGTEATASYLLSSKFRAEPNNTYVVFYEVFNGFYSPQNNNVTVIFPMVGSAKRPDPNIPGDFGVITHGVADFGKSLQMLKISYRIDPFADQEDPLYVFKSKYGSVYVDKYGFKWYHFPGFVGEPKEHVDTVLNTLIYKMAFQAIPRIKDIGIFDNPQCARVLTNSSIIIPYVVASMTGNGEIQPIILQSPLRYFKPVAVSVGCPVVSVDENTGTVRFTAVMVFIYQWTW